MIQRYLVIVVIVFFSLGLIANDNVYAVLFRPGHGIYMLLNFLFLGHRTMAAVAFWLGTIGIWLYTKIIGEQRGAMDVLPATAQTQDQSAVVREQGWNNRAHALIPAGVISDYPKWFDQDSFLQTAKDLFLRHINTATKVLTLNAVLLDFNTESEFAIASVQFTGMVRKDADAVAIPMNEIRRFKHLKSENWVLAGLQQASH